MQSSLGTLPLVCILIVEADKTVADLLNAAFNAVHGWAATVARHASAARVALSAVRVEVIVLSMDLPGIGGAELLAGLTARPEWHQPIVILVSNDTDLEAVDDALARGHAVRVLRKPVDVHALIEQVRQMTG